MKKFEELVFSNGTAGIVDTSWGPIKIGIYAKYLERWLQYFSLNQFLFISGERLIVDPAYVPIISSNFIHIAEVIMQLRLNTTLTKVLSRQIRNGPGSRFPRTETCGHRKALLFQFQQRISLLTEIRSTSDAPLSRQKQRTKSSAHRIKCIGTIEAILSSVQYEVLSHDWHPLRMDIIFFKLKPPNSCIRSSTIKICKLPSRTARWEISWQNFNQIKKRQDFHFSRSYEQNEQLLHAYIHNSRRM